MKIIISPAKKMISDTNSFAYDSLPRFLSKAECLLVRMRELSRDELKALWKCNDHLADLNFKRIQTMDLRHNLTPAIMAYEGIQYRYMAPGVLSDRELVYLEEQLRILSGFYGLLRPFDGVTPYRLEMQTKLKVQEKKNLYDFWSDSICKALLQETECIINLASKEYSQCISKYLPKSARMITCIFGENHNGKILEKGTMCKMARGEMVRWMAEARIKSPDQLKKFDRLQYRFSLENSSDNIYVFLKEELNNAGNWNESSRIHIGESERKGDSFV